jgi:RimJ/RimL family protein N-acetyltransferase
MPAATILGGMLVKVTIAPIEAIHVDGYHRALDKVARERRFLTFLEAPALSVCRDYVMSNIARGLPHYVALAGRKVAGWCDIVPMSRPVLAHGGVLGMALLPAFRGQGHGKALIKAALAAAHKFGLVRIQLTVVADNAPAIALYEKVGFEREGILRDETCIDGVYKDAIMMALIDPVNRLPVWSPPES